MSIGHELRRLYLGAVDTGVAARTFAVPSAPFDAVLPERYERLFATFDLRASALSDFQYQELAGVVRELSRDLRLREMMEKNWTDRPDATGSLILDFSNVVSDRLCVRDHIVLTATCTIFGRPFGAFRKFGLWKPIDVNPAIDPWRAGAPG